MNAQTLNMILLVLRCSPAAGFLNILRLLSGETRYWEVSTIALAGRPVAIKAVFNLGFDGAVGARLIALRQARGPARPEHDGKQRRLACR